MKVLIMGGTGAMGDPLKKILCKQGHRVFVTSREKHESDEATFFHGNAHDLSFMINILKDNYDVIIDFMSYKTREFYERVKMILSSCKQYIFVSSARVYSECDSKITESHPLLVDACMEKEYLKTDEYALSKARQEYILRDNKYDNWTIIRPTITYNTERLQYAIGEKEDWLYRYLNNEKVVFPVNLSDVIVTMCYGGDVAYAISLLVGNEKARKESIHIAGAHEVTWKEVNEIYSKELYKRYNRPLEFKYVEDWEQIGHLTGKFYQFKYARAISRRFDNSKLESIIGKISFMHPQDGLVYCLNSFLDGKKKFKVISKEKERIYDKYCIVSDVSNQMRDSLTKYEYIIEKDNRILRLYERWLRNNVNGNIVTDFLNSNGFTNVAIYGFGTLGRSLCNILEKSEIRICCIIDKNKEKLELLSKYIFKSPQEDIKVISADALIITAICDYDEVYRDMRDKIECPIFLLEDLV